jgi:hypothetical protein
MPTPIATTNRIQRTMAELVRTTAWARIRCTTSTSRS